MVVVGAPVLFGDLETHVGEAKSNVIEEAHGVMRIVHKELHNRLFDAPIKAFLLLCAGPLVCMAPLFCLPMGPASDRISDANADKLQGRMNEWIYGYFALGLYLLWYSGFLAALFRPLTTFAERWWEIFCVSIVASGILASFLLRSISSYSKSLIGAQLVWNAIFLLSNAPVCYLVWHIFESYQSSSRNGEGDKTVSAAQLGHKMDEIEKSSWNLTRDETNAVCAFSKGSKLSKLRLLNKYRAQWDDAIQTSRKIATKWGLATVGVYFLMSFMLQAFIQHFVAKYQSHDDGWWRIGMIFFFFFLLEVARTIALTFAWYVDLAYTTLSLSLSRTHPHTTHSLSRTRTSPHSLSRTHTHTHSLSLTHTHPRPPHTLSLTHPPTHPLSPTHPRTPTHSLFLSRT
jgi:hypothetical protein